MMRGMLANPRTLTLLRLEVATMVHGPAVSMKYFTYALEQGE